MKKYILIILVTLSVILIVFAQGNTKIDNIEYVNAVPVSKKEARERLIFNGTVEYKDSCVCTSDGIGMVTEVLVSENSFVEKGSPVLIAMQTYEDIDIADIVTAITSQSNDVYSRLLDNNCKAVVYKAEKSGYLRSVSAEKGSFYLKGSELFNISNGTEYRIRINISEKDINKVKCGQMADIICRSGDKYSGIVESISENAKLMTDLSGQQSVIQAIIKFTDKEINVKSGYTVQCSVLTKSKEDVILVPYSSVGNDENGECFVYLFDGKHFVKHYVVCGYEYSNGQEIISGLSENELIACEISKIKNVENAVIGEVKINAQ